MLLNPLTAISHVDGRYYTKLTDFSDYFSEFALIKYRVKVEVEYFLALSKEGVFVFPDEKKASFRKIVSDFSLDDAQKIKDTEKVTNHDVKAVEYFVKEKLEDLDCGDKSEWVHFGLTSQDINNTATPLMWKEGLESVYLPELEHIIDELKKRV